MDIQKNEKRHRSRGHDEPPRKKPVRKERPKAKPKIETTAAQPVLSERDRKRHRQVWIQRIVIALVLCTILVGGVICLKIFLTPKTVNVSVPYTESAETEAAQAKVPMPDIDLQLLTVNEYSRPGLSTGTINGVVVHYTANPGSTAQQNRDYFENLKDTHTTKVSSNFVIGLEGEIIYACGPTPMLKALKEFAGERKMECWISMEERMACGIGACLGCVCKSKEIDAHSLVHNKRVCKDGPVFLSTEVEL